MQTSKDRAAIEALEDTVLVPQNMPQSLLLLEEAVREGSVWEAAPPEDTHCPSLPSDDNAALPEGHHIPRGFDLNVITFRHSAVDQQLLEDCLRMYWAIGYVTLHFLSSYASDASYLTVRVIPACTHAVT